MNDEWFARAADLWWAWTLSCLSGGVLLYAIAEVMLRFGKRLSTQVRYAILLIVLIKYAVPSAYVFDVPVKVGGEKRVAPTFDSLPVDFGNAPISADILPLRPEMEEKPHWAVPPHNQILFTFNLAGSLGIALYLLVKVLRTARSSTRIPNDSPIGQLCKKACERFHRKIPRLFSAEASGEASAGGFWRSYIILPKNLLEKHESQIELVLAHELAHLKRWDHRANWLQLAISTLFWWNPIVARLNHLIRCEREQCCDDFVLRTPGVDPRDYSHVLLDAVERQAKSRRFSLAAAFASPRQVVQQRIRRITMFNRKDKRYSLLGLSIVLLFALTLGFGFQIARAKSDNKQELADLIAELKNLQNAVSTAYEKDIEIDGKIVEQLRQTLAQLKGVLGDSYKPAGNSEGAQAPESSATFTESGFDESKAASAESTSYSTCFYLPKSESYPLADLLASICFDQKESIRQQFELATSEKPYGNDRIHFFTEEIQGKPVFVFGSPRKDIIDFVNEVVKEYQESPQHQISAERMESLRSQWRDIQLYMGYFIGEETASRLGKELERTLIDDLEAKILTACLAKNQAEVDHWINELTQLVSSTLKKIAPEKELPKEFTPELVQQDVFRKAVQKNRYWMRKMQNILEVCFIDFNQYPQPIEGFELNHAGIKYPNTDKILRLNSTEPVIKRDKPLDFPMPFLTEYPNDLFNPQKQTYRYNSNGQQYYVLVSTGPDGDFDYDVSQYKGERTNELAAYQYDVTNGILSSGDIIRIGP